MYELVNTSVPNGLVAGTHGFATVAMTKGLPDAIRTSLENFCAYPHRTSAHDASYYEQNPVNWFHLTLPTGEHVVGRTAPCEFDYTGRTNRLAHLLCFPAKEMPLNGGAFVLKSEGVRFAEPWQGEPRYLAADKARTAQLQMADSQRGREPANWVSLFGEKGVEYAKRFAALLAQNLRGAGKSISFKAGATDIDGTRLLGLFSDLINLLPENLAAKATFATFAACVPGGVTCHLRGVFDRDQTFDASSALSPWVDCEAGVVRNENLLPPAESARNAAAEAGEPFASSVVSETMRGAGVSRHNFSSPNFGPRTGRGPRAADILGAYARKGGKKDFPWVTCLWIGAPVVITLAALAFCVWYLHPQKKSVTAETQIQSLETDFEEANRNQEQAREEARRREREEPEKAAQADADREEMARREAAAREENARKISEAAVKKQQENEKKAKEEQERKRKLAEKPLAELSITDVIDSETSKPWQERLAEMEKRALTNENSLVVIYPSNGEATRRAGRLVEKTEVDRRTKKAKRTEWVVQISGEARVAPWSIIYIPTLQKVYWLWQGGEKRKAKLFLQDDEVDLAAFCFDGVEDAATLYGKTRAFEYAVSWDDMELEGKNPIRSGRIFSIDQLKPDQKALEREIDRQKKSIKTKETEIAKHETQINGADVDREEMLKFLADYLDAKEKAKEKKDEDKGDDKERSAELNKIRREAYTVFKKHADKFKSYLGKGQDKESKKQVDVACLESLNKDIINNSMTDKLENLKRKKKELEAIKTTHESVLGKMQKQLNNWQGEVRTRVFEVEILLKGRK